MYFINILDSKSHKKTQNPNRKIIVFYYKKTQTCSMKHFKRFKMLTQVVNVNIYRYNSDLIKLNTKKI